MSDPTPTTADATNAPAAPPSDYVALATFDELPLSEETRRSIAEKGYTRPTPVQAQALRPILAQRDVIVRSKTGTGKTAAFGIPLVELVDPSAGYVQAIVLCNTRELALQVATEVESIGKYRGVKVAPIYGGASFEKQLSALRNGAAIVVGTPGRIIDLLERRDLILDRVKLVVLDEADEMLGEGFLEDVRRIMRRCPDGHQTALFSATLTPDIERLVRDFLRDPETILLSGDVYTVAGIRHIRYFAQDAYPKPRNLLYMLQLENPENAIVFCNTRDDVNLVANVLNKNGFDAEKLSGELAQGERERVMARVKRGEVRFLVATDIAARGIDISDLTHVINYSLPEDPSVYLHRVGRTGRIGKTGTALSLVRGTELVTLTALEKKFSIKFEEKLMPTPDEAHKLWVDTHLDELRQASSTQIYDAFLPLAMDLKNRPGGELLVAYVLKYFFQHHRQEKLVSARQEDERRVQRQKEEEKNKELDKRRVERAKPKLEPAPAPAPAAAPEAAPSSGRLYVGLGTKDGLDDAGLRTLLLEQSGASADAIVSVELQPGSAYVEVDPARVEAFIALNGRSLGDRTLKVEIARPRNARAARGRSDSPRSEKPEGAEPKRNRLYVGLGSVKGHDEAQVREALASLSGEASDGIQSVDVMQNHSYVDVDPAKVDAFLAANGKAWKDEALKVEVARPEKRRRR